MDCNKAIGQNLNRLRLRAQLTQEQLCELAEVDRSYLQRLEKGSSSPTLEVMVRIKKALNCNWAELLRKIG
ncbi:MAG: helix-turn-helix domain-containing protein [Verrucomicrobiales bacterium]|nr:helix-turn-helix domain-containing protein [Verrucomicrobiales bacterium]MDR1305614.1 helix-turn-helix domain-containing protein [Verrucomicrobiales bacterium]